MCLYVHIVIFLGQSTKNTWIRMCEYVKICWKAELFALSPGHFLFRHESTHANTHIYTKRYWFCVALHVCWSAISAWITWTARLSWLIRDCWWTNGRQQPHRHARIHTHLQQQQCFVNFLFAQSITQSFWYFVVDNCGGVAFVILTALTRIFLQIYICMCGWCMQ